MESLYTLRHGSPVWRVRFHPGGRLLLSSGQFGASCLWAVPEDGPPALLRRFASPEEDHVTQDVIVAPEGDRTVLVGANPPLECWRLQLSSSLSSQAAPALETSLQRNYGPVVGGPDARTGGVCPAGRCFLLSYQSRGMELFQFPEFQSVQTIPHSADALAFHPEGRLVVWAREHSQGAVISFGLLEDRAEAIQLQKLPLHLHVHFMVRGLHFGPGGGVLVVTGGWHGEITEAITFPSCVRQSHFVDVVPPELLFLVPEGRVSHSTFGRPDRALITPDDRQLIQGLASGALGVQSLEGAENTTHPAHDCFVTSLDAHYPSGRLASAALDGTIILWANAQFRTADALAPSTTPVTDAFLDRYARLRKRHEDEDGQTPYSKWSENRSWQMGFWRM